MSERQLGEVQFLTVAEVASIMRVSKMTVYRMVHAGELPAIRVGRSFRVPEDEVHKYLRSSFIDTACASSHEGGGPSASARPFVVPPIHRYAAGPAGVRVVTAGLGGGRAVARLGSRRRPLTCARRTIHCHQQGMPHGFSHQEAPQADGQEEAPQVAAQDASPASQQEVSRRHSAALTTSPHEPLPSGASSSVTCVAAGDRRPTRAGRVDQARTRPTRSQEAQ